MEGHKLMKLYKAELISENGFMILHDIVYVVGWSYGAAEKILKGKASDKNSKFWSGKKGRRICSIEELKAPVLVATSLIAQQ